MSMAKSLGGMGFHDLYGFNLALLGKHCWNFIINPNSPVARVFKARYFNNTSFFEATRGGGASFVWSGLWQAKEVLKKGYKWVLGDGQSIRICQDPWIRGNENSLLDGTYANLSNESKVCELMVPEERRWDVNKVTNLFTVSDATAILAVPIPRVQVPDRIAWTSSVDGLYNVKSGYRFWQQHFSESRHGFVHKGG